MVQVVAALIWEKDKFMICQRPANKARALLWEFVGGKVEPGETMAQALIRECQEELAITISVGDVFMEVIHTYPDITVHLTLFNATVAEGIPQMLEHNDLQWITPGEISNYDFCPADEEILTEIKKQFTNETLDYYNKNADAFIAGTRNADMSGQYRFFLKHLPTQGKLLDLGCGSGRDSAYFASLGFEVTAVDGSEELCKRARENFSINAQCIRFEDVCFKAEFDAIWACASLLHVKKADMPGVLDKVSAALKSGGVMYASFKYGNGERVSGGRFFNDYTECDIGDLLTRENKLSLVECLVTEDVRPEHSGEKWLNIIARKEV